ncbi:hypothetical protein HY29_01200 [Hyphomonas beringensis]|uniref:Uncharacterized protein n=1 Tax=Hyphomonas beringensis TaxID=1280946 RepID=A0A062UI29_9PROT|nr:hypothetical protein HY29_01200 [Hyphomonas beringensis]
MPKSFSLIRIMHIVATKRRQVARFFASQAVLLRLTRKTTFSARAMVSAFYLASYRCLLIRSQY